MREWSGQLREGGEAWWWVHRGWEGDVGSLRRREWLE
jgi:hypothetical protein